MVEFSTGKSVLVLATVVGCFAILWPRIFYPMMQAALSLTSPSTNDDVSGIPRPNPYQSQPPHLHLPPRMREAMAESRPDFPREANIKDGRPFPHPSSRQPPKPTGPKTGGTMSIVMPIYTIGIVGFFLYTILKLVFRKKDEANSDEKSSPTYQNFHMDPNRIGNSRASNLDYQKQRYQPTTTATIPTPTNQRTQSENDTGKTKKILKDFGKQKEDFEIRLLRRKLLETEERMEKLLSGISEQEFDLSPAATHEHLILKNLQRLSQMQDAQLLMHEAETAMMQPDDEEEEELEEAQDESDATESIDTKKMNGCFKMGDSCSTDSESYETVSAKEDDSNHATSVGNLEQKKVATAQSSTHSAVEEVQPTELEKIPKVSIISSPDPQEESQILEEVENEEEDNQTELRQRVRNVGRNEFEDFTYRNRSCSYSDVLNF